MLTPKKSAAGQRGGVGCFQDMVFAGVNQWFFALSELTPKQKNYPVSLF